MGIIMEMAHKNVAITPGPFPKVMIIAGDRRGIIHRKFTKHLPNALAVHTLCSLESSEPQEMALVRSVDYSYTPLFCMRIRCRFLPENFSRVVR